jgi:Lipid A 3-O-deacylase (PagL)
LSFLRERPQKYRRRVKRKAQLRARSGICRPLRPWRVHARRKYPGVVFALLLALWISPGSCGTATLPGCHDCDLSLGFGGTYHFWGRTGGFVLPATLTWDRGRYEVGLFRMTSEQTLFESRLGQTRVVAEPYWAISASRRWQLAARPFWRLFFGFGASCKTKEDFLNSTHWNFASQLGVKLHPVSGQWPDTEVAIRHWSNAGLRAPNRGQDFLTVTVAF